MQETIDIWYIPLSELSVTQQHMQIIDEQEQIKANKFYKESDRVNYILSHAYLRIILSQYLQSVNPDALKFKHNRYGKPYLMNTGSQPLYFSLSHTSSAAYVLVYGDEKCGIDAEDISPMDLTEEFLALSFSKKENAKLKKSNYDIALFYTFWTLKEAHLKALGTGLTNELSEICFADFVDDNNEVKKEEQHVYYTFKHKNQQVSLAIMQESSKVLRKEIITIKNIVS